ncbi:MAG: MogA/MoaB family molybdenum cofactor biosynthesis protein [Phycisphaerae bacterium]|jgi:molybdenum cofactor synthesis domain-containing protein
MKAAIMTVSDRCWQGRMNDQAGPALAALVRDRLGGQVVAATIVPDDAGLIAEQLRRWAAGPERPDLILTTGGTGLGPRDVTPEATASVLDRPHPALLELARLRCLQKTPRAFLSRGLAGTIGAALVINLPGSTRGAVEFLEALLDVLPHAVDMLRGRPGDHSPPEGGKDEP